MARRFQRFPPKEVLSRDSFPRYFRSILPDLEADDDFEYDAFLCFADGLKDDAIANRLRTDVACVRTMRNRFLVVREVVRVLLEHGQTSIPVKISSILDWNKDGSGPTRIREKICIPPGSRLWKLAQFFCTKKTYYSVFGPLLADFHHEYFDALSAGCEWKARWLRVLYYGAFFKSAGLNVAMRFLREAWDRFKRA